MDLKDLKIEREYIGGINLETHSIRKHQYTIKCNKHKTLNGQTFYSETETKKDKHGIHTKKGEIHYYKNNSKELYKTIKELLNSIIKEF